MAVADPLDGSATPLTRGAQSSWAARAATMAAIASVMRARRARSTLAIVSQAAWLHGSAGWPAMAPVAIGLRFRYWLAATAEEATGGDARGGEGPVVGVAGEVDRLPGQAAALERAGKRAPVSASDPGAAPGSS